jgi:hypothetical protein
LPTASPAQALTTAHLAAITYKSTPKEIFVCLAVFKTAISALTAILVLLAVPDINLHTILELAFNATSKDVPNVPHKLHARLVLMAIPWTLA